MKCVRSFIEVVSMLTVFPRVFVFVYVYVYVYLYVYGYTTPFQY